MNYLFVDTAEGTRVLLSVGGKYYYDENLKQAGAEALMPMIDRLLKRADAEIKSLDILGACVGPGSFTGIRIGLTTVKTLCYALGKPCFGVNNLRLNSYNNKSGKVVSVADAGNKVCYIACFDGDTEIIPTKCVTRDDAAAIVSEKRNAGYSVSTDLKLGDAFENAVSGVGESELRIAVEKHICEEIDYKELMPLYVRKAQPERGEGDL